MKRRLRKKLHLAEFTEFAFDVRATFVPPLDGAQNEAFLDRLIDAVEARGLRFGGGVALEELDGFIHGRRPPRVTPAERDVMADRLRAQPEVSEVEAGPLWNCGEKCSADDPTS